MTNLFPYVACGCRYMDHSHGGDWRYFPQVSLQTHATILSSISRTVLTQTFTNPSVTPVKEVSYTFPLYDGVSVVGFTCRVGDRVLHSQVKTKEQASEDYTQAIQQSQSASILNHSDSTRDVLTIRLGNVNAGEQVVVEITFVGDLKQDTQADGVRYTIPNAIAPRYGEGLAPSSPFTRQAQNQGISITVDVLMEKPSVIREIQSPSHPIRVSLGRMSTESTSVFEANQASCSLQLTGNVPLERDFVVVVNADSQDLPHALLEEHPTIPGQKALIMTMVPKFSLPPIYPEIMFVIDRSGSMRDKIPSLKSALIVFLKSLPVGVCFNICSFGTHYSFLWQKSVPYDSASLQYAMQFVESISSNMGGTEIQGAVEATVANRLEGKLLEVIILTDGQTSDQDSLFSFVRQASAGNHARFFSLGIGNAASHSLIEGVARAGNGFSQSVFEYEELSKKIVRMLKGALLPHIYNYKLEVEFDGTDVPDITAATETTDEFEIVEDVSESESATERGTVATPSESPEHEPQKPISLFDNDYKEPEIKPSKIDLPKLTPPDLLQAPWKIPTLYPLIRSTICILLDPRLSNRNPQALTLRATSEHGALELKIPIQSIGKGETIHQIASRKAVVELEEGHGWIEDAKDSNGRLTEDLSPEIQRQLTIQECQNLGIKYQVTGKHCSFVALDENGNEQPKQPESRFGKEEYAAASANSGGKAKKARGRLGSTAFRQQAVPNLFAGVAPPPACSVSGGSLFGVTAVPREPTAASSSSRSMFGNAPAPYSSFQFQHAPAASPPTTDYGLFASTSALSSTLFRAPPGPAVSIGTGLFGTPAPSSSLPFGTSSAAATSAGSLFGAAQPAHPSPAAQTSTLDGIIKLQTFDGSWNWTKELTELLSIDENNFREKLSARIKQNHDIELLWRQSLPNFIATMLVMRYLEQKATQDKAVWELVYEKAEGWIQRQSLWRIPKIFEACTEVAEVFV
ncbi:uncharacterized protein EURHEDRAFT_408922 [Aspergillus ruber CBS 135680]|uniref:von Willebrand factor type A domain-containing protein n=1 Tax=Aspergillus ruber (strain CBS 135680) TaxID=1388766 RepID=A0A017SQQ4_ASPRC|nr:uncharacterized protein EURHEDRAFT_408922 [Aspergillus ruber CBS 135680]EYE98570.1 hypothetical protein EURHEDRAFT_408922 [Aspergillus ruber CBS 135680]